MRDEPGRPRDVTAARDVRSPLRSSWETHVFFSNRSPGAGRSWVCQLSFMPNSHPHKKPRLPVALPPTAEAPFSDDEDASGRGAGAAAEGKRRQGPANWEAPGFDLSGSPSADASQQLCVLCSKPLEVSWHEGRQELVVADAVMLCHRLYHQRCADEWLQLLRHHRRVAERPG